MPDKINVFCTVVEDEALAHICGQLYFCTVCGSPDHKEVKP